MRKKEKYKNLEKEITELKQKYNELNNKKIINENQYNNKIKELENKLKELNENKLLDNPQNGKYNKCIIILISKI